MTVLRAARISLVCFVALVLQKKDPTATATAAAEPGPSWTVPTRLDRADFVRAEAP